MDTIHAWEISPSQKTPITLPQVTSWKKKQKTREKAKGALAKAIQYMKTANDKHKNTKTREYTKGTLI